MDKTFESHKVSSYFKAEWSALLLTTMTGLIYNLGLMVVTVYEGKLAQCLYDIFEGRKNVTDMIIAAGCYLAVIVIVQSARYFKRFYVRRFSNNTNRRMKQVLYGSLVRKSKTELEKESVGSVMTKAISDVDDCVEGMRKFTTEVFDTGIAMIGYMGMMLYYDWHLAVICLLFPSASYVLAEKMKVPVQRLGKQYKESVSRLSLATMDRVGNSITYRVYGCEDRINKSYEMVLKDYERAAVRSQIVDSALQPVYHVISMMSVIFILSSGGKNVLNNVWDIGVFTAYLSCYGKLSIKAAKTAKLFNAVHKAQVSWKRIYPFMKAVSKENISKQLSLSPNSCSTLRVEKLGVKSVFSGLSFAAKPGQIIGVTGAVASGKTVLGKAFLQEESHEGKIFLGDEELRASGNVGYLGHSPELFSDTIENNILLGDEKDVWEYLKLVEMDMEVESMPEGIHTKIGTDGLLLSGGQKQRLALARTLAHPRPVMILDDPFSALDKDTEMKIFDNLRKYTKDNIVLLISHRLYIFPQLEKVIWIENGEAQVANHDKWMECSLLYRKLYELQSAGGENDE